VDRRLAVVLVVVAQALAIAPRVDAQNLLYDDGGDHVLSDPGLLGYDSIVEVRDGPGSDPTHLDVTIEDSVYDVSFRSYGTSTIRSFSQGLVDFDAYEGSTITIEEGEHDVNGWQQSHVIVRGSLEFSTANDSATTTFEPGTGFVNFHHGYDQSTTVMQAGSLHNLYLLDSASMSVLGGGAGYEDTFVEGNAFLNVDGGDIHHGDAQLGVSGSGRVDIHSGATDSFSRFFYRVSDTGLIRLFGRDFLLDGTPIGAGDVTALPGGAEKRGSLSGVLESGHFMEVDFSVSGSGAIRIVPEPRMGALVALGLSLALWTARPRARRAGAVR
jgi:hypothetical protein